VPPVNTSGVGAGAVALVPDTESRVAAGVIFKDLKSRPTAVHIHGPANPGANAPVLFTLRIISADHRNQKWSGEAIGYFNVTPQQLADLRAGRWYMDVHTQDRPDGEIRGQLTVPSKASYRLNATGSPFSASLVLSKSDETLASINGGPPLEFWKILDTTGDSEWMSVRDGKRTVQDRGDMASDTAICLPVVLDLAERKAVWADIGLKRRPRHINKVEGNGSQMTLLLNPSITFTAARSGSAAGYAGSQKAVRSRPGG
jgi:hypothetical protein